MLTHRNTLARDLHLPITVDRIYHSGCSRLQLDDYKALQQIIKTIKYEQDMLKTEALLDVGAFVLVCDSCQTETTVMRETIPWEPTFAAAALAKDQHIPSTFSSGTCLCTCAQCGAQMRYRFVVTSGGILTRFTGNACDLKEE